MPKRSSFNVGQVTIDTAHDRVHRGQMFFASIGLSNAAGLADDNFLDLLIETGTKEPHITFDAAAGGDARLLTYEDANVASSDFTPLTVFNMDRGSANTTSISVGYRTSATAISASSDGTLFENVYLPGGTGPQSAGGVARSGTEWEFEEGKKYLLRIMNEAGAAQPASWAVEFYEDDL